MGCYVHTLGSSYVLSWYLDLDAWGIFGFQSPSPMYSEYEQSMPSNPPSEVRTSTYRKQGRTDSQTPTPDPNPRTTLERNPRIRSLQFKRHELQQRPRKVAMSNLREVAAKERDAGQAATSKQARRDRQPSTSDTHPRTTTQTQPQNPILALQAL